MNEEHYPASDPKPPGLGPHHGLGPKEKRRKTRTRVQTRLAIQPVKSTTPTNPTNGKGMPRDSFPSRVGDTSAGRMLLEGWCPLCCVTLVIHGDATCCPCCGCQWRATIDSIELLSCGRHPIRACRHWVTICEAADHILNATTHRHTRARP